MDAILLSIGTELTDGAVADSNAPWLARRLRELGIRVARVVVVPDELGAMARAVTEAAREATLVLATGGLGPTADDRTHEAVAAAFGVDFVVERATHEAVERRLQEERGTAVHLAEAQFQIPRGGQALANPLGIALGFVARLRRLPREDEPNDPEELRAAELVAWHTATLAADEALLAVLPGVPHEMRAMFESSLAPLLDTVLPPRVPLRSAVVRIAAAEATVQRALADLLEADAPLSASLTLDEEAGFVALHFTSTDATVDTAEAERRLQTAVATVRERLGEAVFGDAEETSVAHALLERLAARDYTVGLAESCTGGLATYLLARIPGVSAYLQQSVVAYSNDAKMARLGVPESLLDEHGAVSEPVALAMAEGMRRSAGVNVALGITGIAGPGGATEDKPVGLVYIGVALPSHSYAVRRVFTGDRAAIQRRAAQYALDQARRALHDAE